MTLEPFVLTVLNYGLAALVVGGVAFAILLMAVVLVKAVLSVVVRLTPSSKQKIDLSNEDQIAQGLLSDLQTTRRAQFALSEMDPERRKNLQRMMAARDKRLASRKPIAPKPETETDSGDKTSE